MADEPAGDGVKVQSIWPWLQIFKQNRCVFEDANISKALRGRCWDVAAPATWQMACVREDVQQDTGITAGAAATDIQYEPAKSFTQCGPSCSFSLAKCVQP